MIGQSSDVSALVGLDGFVVRAQTLDEDSGEWLLAVETIEDRAWCPVCGARATGHGRRRVRVRDLPIADRPVVLVWAKRLWRCGEDRCQVGSWSEDSDEIAPRAVLTERARAEMARRVGPGEHSVARLARDFGVSWHTAMAAVWDHGQPRVDHLARLGAPAAIGLDETSLLSATATHPTLLVTGVVDVDTGRLVDVLPARSATAVRAWLAAKPGRWRVGIGHVVIDPYQPYASAVAAELPQARLVVDHFHAIRLGNQVLDEVRRRRLTNAATEGTNLVVKNVKRLSVYRPSLRLVEVVHHGCFWRVDTGARRGRGDGRCGWCEASGGTGSRAVVPTSRWRTTSWGISGRGVSRRRRCARMRSAC